jgi:hypothetical protein
MNYGYARVSTDGQSLDREIAGSYNVHWTTIGKLSVQKGKLGVVR